LIGLRMTAETFPQVETLQYALFRKIGVCWCGKDHLVVGVVQVQTPTRTPQGHSGGGLLEERFPFWKANVQCEYRRLKEQELRWDNGLIACAKSAQNDY
jgi:hypothetical protein